MKKFVLALGLTVAAAGLLTAGAARADATQDLLKAKNCMGCHDIEKKKIGPSFKDIAAKYKTDKDAEKKLTTLLKEAKGHPVKVAATDAELQALVKHVLAQ